MPEDNIEELPRLFPDRDWECATPESQGIDSGVLSDALSEFEAVCGTDKLSQTLLIRHGKLVWQGPHIDSAHNVWSCTKSFGSIVLGLLVEEGKCSLETLLCEIIPELRSDYSTLKIRHLVLDRRNAVINCRNRVIGNLVDSRDERLIQLPNHRIDSIVMECDSLFN